jgi:hypothetical protein
LLRYRSHINVEIAGTVKVIAYLKKYMSKLPDATRFSIDDVLRDPGIELDNWQKLRHTTCSEACQRLHEFDLNYSSVGCTILFVHKEGEHSVRWYDDPERSDAALVAASRSDSQLLRYFWRHSSLDELKFEEYFGYYSLRAGRPRQGAYKEDSPPEGSLAEQQFAVKRRADSHVARIETAFTSDLELWAMHAILRRNCCRSFEGMRTVEGITYPSCAEACKRLGIFTGYDDAEFVLREMINPDPAEWARDADHVRFMCDPDSLRRTFVMLVIASKHNAELLEPYMLYLATGLPRQRGLREVSREEQRYHLLRELSRLLFRERLTLGDCGLPELAEDNLDIVHEEVSRYSPSDLKRVANRYLDLTPSQRTVVDCIEHSIAQQNDVDAQKLFFLDGKPGRGKTFLINTMVARQRLHGKVVSVSSPSAKGAIQYAGGLTCHKTFGCPIFEETPMLALVPIFGKGHRNARFLREATLLIIDEIAMLHSAIFSMIDTLLRDIMETHQPFGGKVVVCCGDFGQLSPVQRLPGRRAALAVSVHSHPLFPEFLPLKLLESLRSRGDPIHARFCDTLANGNGQDGFFSCNVPREVRMTQYRDSALSIYLDNGLGHYKHGESCLIDLANTRLYKSAIICYSNEQVDSFNDIVSNRVITELALEAHEIWDAVAFEMPNLDDYSIISEDTMIAHNEPGMPPHTLSLFTGALVVLTRNFLPSRGLVNGALLLVTAHTPNTVSVMNVTRDSPFFGEKDTLFRFEFDITIKNLTSFKRKQFPLKLAYAGTVHKFQGDTIHEELLLVCQKPSFAHGQLSVAVSRGTSCAKTAILTTDVNVMTRCLNGLVYREFLDDDAGFEDAVTEVIHDFDVQGVRGTAVDRDADLDNDGGLEFSHPDADDFYTEEFVRLGRLLTCCDEWD